MAREGIIIKKEDLRRLIADNTEKHNLTLGAVEHSIVENIISTFPSAPNTTHLARWCNEKVDEELNKLPDEFKHISKKIKNDVGKELRFIIDKKKFENIHNLIKEEGPESINPAWIRSRDYGLSLAIRRGYKNLDGSVDWNFISKKLNIANKFAYKKKEYKNATKVEVISDLREILEGENPDDFNISWIMNQSGPLAYQLGKLFQDSSNKNNWTDFLEMLGSPWKEKWSYTETNNLLPDLDTALTMLVETLEKFKPDSFTLEWIKDHAHPIYYFFRTSGNKIADNLTKIPPEFARLWSGQRNPEWVTIDDAVKELIDKCKNEDPQNISPGWIFNVHPKLYLFLSSLLGKEKKIKGLESLNWSIVAEKMPLEWRSKFSYREVREINEEKAISEIGQLLATEKPELLTPDWVHNHSSRVYVFVLKNIRNGTYPSWEYFISKIPNEYISLWSRNIYKKREFTEDLKSLNILLARENPKVWSPSWISKKDFNLYNSLLRYKSAEGWTSIVSNVSEQHRKNWQIVRQSIEDAQNDLLALLNRKNPDEFSPGWISEFDPSLYVYIISSFKRNKISWNEFIKKFSLDWQEKWTISQAKRDWNRENTIGFLEELVSRNNPPSFSPSWIIEQDINLYQHLRQYAKFEGWESVIPEQLLPKWDLKEKRFSTEDLPDALANLRLLLNKYQPTSFSPAWIQEHSNYLLSDIYKIFKKENMDWKSLIGMLPEEYRGIWKLQEGKKRTLETAIVELENLLDNNEPNSFSPQWIREQNVSLYVFLIKKIESPKNGWDKIISQLSTEWKEKWTYKELESWTEDLMISTLNKLIDEQKPKKISPVWIAKHNMNLYSAILRKNEDRKENWRGFISQLPENVISIWSYTERKNWHFDEAMKVLIDMCEALKPTRINPRWILINDQSLYHFFKTNFKVKSGLIDWSQVTEFLPAKWNGHWTEKKVLERLLPEQNYSDQKEVQDILDAFGDRAYTLIAPNSNEENIVQNNIINNFVILAQSGNLSAEKYLIDSLKYVTYELIERNEVLKPWTIYPERLSEKIYRSIYLYDVNSKGTFMNYLLKVLTLSIPELEKRYHVSLSEKTRLGKEIESYLSNDNQDDSI